jgi:hypothetical protein
MKKGDPIGQWLWLHLFSPIEDRLFPTRESKDEALKEIRRDDPLVRLGVSQEPPAVWKSLLWWGIFVVGIGLAWYMSFHR